MIAVKTSKHCYHATIFQS